MGRGLSHLKSLTTEQLRMRNRMFELYTEEGTVALISPYWCLFYSGCCFVIF